MQLEHNQPAENGLREALAPWFDHSAAWLVLLCIGLTIFAALTGYTAGATLFTTIVATPAAMSVAWRASRIRELRSERRRAWRWLTIALGAELAATLLVPATREFEYPGLQMAAGLLQFAFFPFAAMAAMGLLFSTRGKAFGPQFWLEATLVSLCVGTVLWLALPHDLPMAALPTRGSWTVGLDAVIGVLAALLLLRRADWQG